VKRKKEGNLIASSSKKSYILEGTYLDLGEEVKKKGWRSICVERRERIQKVS
jgi:hypothetical protein